jgi:hypothetical protein
MKKLRYNGTSDGRVNSEHCLSCEHCGDLEEGAQSFDIDGCSYCDSCLLSGEYTREQLDEVIKSKKWVYFPKAPNYLMTAYFKKNVQISFYRTYKLDGKKSVPDKVQLVLRKNNKAKSLFVKTAQVVQLFDDLIRKNKLQLDLNSFRECYSFEGDIDFSNVAVVSLFKKIHDLAYKKELFQKANFATIQQLSSGQGVVHDIHQLQDFLASHFKEIAEGLPEWIGEDFKPWRDAFKIKHNKDGSDVIVCDLNEYELYWGNGCENGFPDYELRSDLRDCYEWEEELLLISKVLKSSENEVSSFFNKIGVKVTLKGKIVTFTVKS